MYKLFISAILFSFIIAACNNSTQQPQNPATEGPKTKEDSLYRDVMEAHNIAMPKMGKLKGYQSLVQLQLDSLAKLPAAARQGSVALKTTLDSLLESLQYAAMAMDKWMSEFVPDSASENPDLRIQYLESEKRKAEKMKENVLSSIERAKEILKQ
ncbi:MAG: viral A-type inclusion protein [Terrimonas sp.]|nr:viral A-type inclusion protein [Terrimonas sp.]